MIDKEIYLKGLKLNTNNKSALLNIKNDKDMYNTYAKNGFLAANKFNRKKLSIKMLYYIEDI